MSELLKMDKKELWQLFPIVLEPYNPAWKTRYEEEKALLLSSLGPRLVSRISHIGSTAVAGLVSKPTIDILLELPDTSHMEAVVRVLCTLGYITEGDASKGPEKMILMKGYTEQGYAKRVFHLHLRVFDDWNELYFRDYLRDHEKIREAYGALKEHLLKKHRHHRDRYTEKKAGFISKHTALARALYGDRHAPDN